MGRPLIGTPASQRRLSGVVISSIGVITGLMHIDHLLENLHTMPVVSGVVFPLCLSVVLFYAGYWLATSDYRGEQAVTIAVWSVAGAIVSHSSVLLFSPRTYSFTTTLCQQQVVTRLS